MALNCGYPPLLDQMVHRSAAKTPSDITPWSWAEPLIPMAMRWAERIGENILTSTTLAMYCPVRNVRIDRQVRAGLVGVQTTERYRAIADVLARPIGDFQASRFFEFPAMLDIKAMAQIVEAVRTSTGTKRDEAAFLWCMLLSEIVASGDTLKLMTHAASVVAVDAYTSRVQTPCRPLGRLCPQRIRRRSRLVLLCCSYD
ncbi:hypothetical protein MRX96_016212 [Rhipicephalus microplus]